MVFLTFQINLNFFQKRKIFKKEANKSAIYNHENIVSFLSQTKC